MKILCTMPGLFGDILCAGLLASRAVAERFNQPVTLWISHNFATLKPLIEEQEYIEECLTERWNLSDTGPVYTYERIRDGTGAPWRPLEPFPSGPWDKVTHLQYRGWPWPTCYQESARNAEKDLGLNAGELGPDPGRAWIKTATQAQAHALVGNWRAGEIEEKRRFGDVLREAGGVYVAAPNEEAPAVEGLTTVHVGWQETAALFKACGKWVGCQSAPWVLANAVHAAKILTCEPDTRRHDVTFWLPTPGNKRIGMNAQEIRNG